MVVADKVRLSVIVRVVGGESFLRHCLSRLAPQIEGRPIEVIVPFPTPTDGIGELAREFPQVTFVAVGPTAPGPHPWMPATAHELYDRMTARGLGLARGEVVAILEDYGTPDPNWCEEILEAHRLPYGVVGGAVEHAGRGALNWAVYHIDFGRYQLPLREGAANYLTDVNVSYKRAALESVRDLWVDTYNEVTVHWALARKGVILWQRPGIVVRQNRGQLSLPALMAERFFWGRLFADRRVREIPFARRLGYIALSPGLPVVLLGRMARNVFGRRRGRVMFLRSMPAILALTLCWCLGEFSAYVHGPPTTGRVQ
jgi:hypothetical protein